jgi:hypothetical protein
MMKTRRLSLVTGVLLLVAGFQNCGSGSNGSASVESLGSGSKLVLHLITPFDNTENGQSKVAEQFKSVLIQVTGAGMAPISYSWDAQTSGSLPPAFEFSVVPGDERVVEATVETQDHTYFGNATVAVVGNEVHVAVTLVSVTP